MHASADRRNAIRTVMRHLSACDLGGAELVPEGDPRAPEAGASRWIRVTVADGRSSYGGRDSQGHRVRMTVLLLAVDVFVRSGEVDGVVEVDAVEDIASRVVSALAFVDLPLLSLVADPTGATSIPGYALRAMDAPRVTYSTTTEGYERRQVATELLWIAREA